MEQSLIERKTQSIKVQKTLILLALLFFGLALQVDHTAARNVNQIAPDKPQQVELPFKAEAGNRFRVLEEEEKVRQVAGKTKVIHIKRVEYDGEILAVRENGYQIQWTLRSATVENPSDPSLGAKLRTTLAREMLVAFEDQPYTFFSDWGGRPVKVPNWRAQADKAEAALQENLPKTFKSLLGDKAETPQVKNIIAGTVRSLKDVFAGQNETSVASLYEVENIVSSAQNLALPLAVWVDWADSAPVYGNKGAIDTFTNVRLAKFSSEKDEAEIEWRTSFDNKKLATAAAAVLRSQITALKLPEAQSKPILDALDKGLVVERNDKGLAKLRTSDGWAYEVSYEKRIENKSAQFKGLDLEKRTIKIERLSP